MRWRSFLALAVEKAGIANKAKRIEVLESESSFEWTCKNARRFGK